MRCTSCGFDNTSNADTCCGCGAGLASARTRGEVQRLAASSTVGDDSAQRSAAAVYIPPWVSESASLASPQVQHQGGFLQAHSTPASPGHEHSAPGPDDAAYVLPWLREDWPPANGEPSPSDPPAHAAAPQALPASEGNKEEIVPPSADAPDVLQWVREESPPADEEAAPLDPTPGITEGERRIMVTIGWVASVMFAVTAIAGYVAFLNRGSIPDMVVELLNGNASPTALAAPVPVDVAKARHGSTESSRQGNAAPVAVASQDPTAREAGTTSAARKQAPVASVAPTAVGNTQDAQAREKSAGRTRPVAFDRKAANDCQATACNKRKDSARSQSSAAGAHAAGRKHEVATAQTGSPGKSESDANSGAVATSLTEDLSDPDRGRDASESEANSAKGAGANAMTPESAQPAADGLALDKPAIDRVDLPTKVERIERPPVVEKIDKPEKVEKVEKAVDRVDLPAQVERIERTLLAPRL